LLFIFIVIDNTWINLNNKNDKQKLIDMNFVHLSNSWDYEWIKKIKCDDLSTWLQNICKKTKYFINNNKKVDKDFVKLISSWDYEWIKNIKCSDLNIWLQGLCEKTKKFINK